MPNFQLDENPVFYFDFLESRFSHLLLASLWCPVILWRSTTYTLLFVKGIWEEASTETTEKCISILL